MSDNNDRDYPRRGKGMSPLAAGIVGAIIGAIASATAIFFSRKENRDKVARKAGELKDQGTKFFSQIRAKSGEMKETARQKAEQAQEEAKKEADKTRRR